MKKICMTLLGLCLLGEAFAQDDDLMTLRVEARVDYQREWYEGETVHDHSGFKGQYLNVLLLGSITDRLSYAYRQRLNKMHGDQSFFDATDWFYLTFRVTDRWSVSAGKQIVAIGGYEYDKAPIDLYTYSEVWNHVPNYAMGASVSYDFKDGKDRLVAQVCQSPFAELGQSDTYAYNLMWMGSHGCYSTLSSVSMVETARGHYSSYIMLGNLFTMGKMGLSLDVMNRAAAHHAFLFHDYSLVAELTYQPNRSFNFWAKVNYDRNKTELRPEEYPVMPHTELTALSAGIEYFPMKKTRDIRLHAYYWQAWGDQYNPEDVVSGNLRQVNLGLTWRLHPLTWKRRK